MTYDDFTVKIELDVTAEVILDPRRLKIIYFWPVFGLTKIFNAVGFQPAAPVRSPFYSLRSPTLAQRGADF
jgi:hypothetical protein